MADQFMTLITPDQLRLHLNDKGLLIVDCTFYLPDPDQGYLEYLSGHIPNAIYAHLNRDLSGRITPTTGRHPLPDSTDFNALIQKWGLEQGMQVVAYDSSGGNMAAARLWWLLNYYGFHRVALLDGGYINWSRLEYPISTDIPLLKRSKINLTPDETMVIDARLLDKLHKEHAYKMLDGRARNRFLGLEEVIDPVPGHIPGAVSAPVTDYLDEDMIFKPKPEIKAQINRLLGDTPPENSIYYCGSGVTAALGVFTMVYAGFPIGKLYPGSWSEWIKQSWAQIAAKE
jgi:thiosulfate/3-mercaptopyruvate sulfurtransferase